VVDSSVSGQGNCVDGDPLPELNILSHRVSLHLTLHLNVEDLQCLPSCQQSHAPISIIKQCKLAVKMFILSSPLLLQKCKTII